MILIHSLVFIYLYIIKKQKSFLCTHGLTDIGFFNPHYSEIQPCTCTLENKSEFDTTFKTFIIVTFYHSMPFSCFQSYQADNHIVSVPDRFFVKDQVQLAYRKYEKTT